MQCTQGLGLVDEKIKKPPMPCHASSMHLCLVYTHSYANGDNLIPDNVEANLMEIDRYTTNPVTLANSAGHEDKRGRGLRSEEDPFWNTRIYHAQLSVSAGNTAVLHPNSWKEIITNHSPDPALVPKKEKKKKNLKTLDKLPPAITSSFSQSQLDALHGAPDAGEQSGSMSIIVRARKEIPACFVCILAIKRGLPYPIGDTI